MELAVAIHDGTAVVIASQDPTRTAAAESADRAAFRTFLAGTRPRKAGTPGGPPVNRSHRKQLDV